jgi:hypothetical protein
MLLRCNVEVLHIMNCTNSYQGNALLSEWLLKLSACALYGIFAWLHRISALLYLSILWQ